MVSSLIPCSVPGHGLCAVHADRAIQWTAHVSVDKSDSNSRGLNCEIPSI